MRVAVRDSGVGIPADDLPKVFKAFWTTKPGGMGMGLAVCKSIIEAFGGELRVAPNAGRGVTFFFTLPLSLASPAGKREGAPSAAGERIAS